MSIHHPPCVMTNTDQFFVRICGCGVVHLSFGPAIINVTQETAIAISETLREVSLELRKRIACYDPADADQAANNPNSNVVLGRFPAPSG
jgi:hypothetical protein